jgi:hypothetical protein
MSLESSSSQPSIESLIAENERLRGELEHARAMVAVESQQRALLERISSNQSGSLVDDLIANARSRELNERQSLLTDLELKQHTIIALQTEVDFLVSRVMAAGDKLSQLSDIAHTNEQNLLELDAMRSRLLEEEHAFAQLEASKATLVNELETLTQSLFEEANLLVSTEARERASAEADKLRLERELVAKELALRISKDLLANLGRKIHVASAAAAAHTHDDQVPRSAPLPHFATGVAVRRRSIGALGAASLAASMVDASSAALASVHISSDYFPAAPSFAELFAAGKRDGGASAANVSDDNDIDELEGEVCDYNCSGLTRGHDWHRRVPLLRCVLVADVVPCLNPFGDAHVNAAELGGSNVSLFRALFPPGRQRSVSELLDAALDRLCEVERLSVSDTQHVTSCIHCRHVRNCAYVLRVAGSRGRPLCKPCSCRIAAVQQYVQFMDRMRCGAHRLSMSEAFAVFCRHRIAMHVARILCITQSIGASEDMDSTLLRKMQADVASADWFSGASADEAFFSLTVPAAAATTTKKR